MRLRGTLLVGFLLSWSLVTPGDFDCSPTYGFTDKHRPDRIAAQGPRARHLVPPDAPRVLRRGQGRSRSGRKGPVVCAGREEEIHGAHARQSPEGARPQAEPSQVRGPGA